MTEGRTLISQSAYARRIGITPQGLEYHIKRGTVALIGPKRLVCIEDADASMREHKHPSYERPGASVVPVGDGVERPQAKPVGEKPKTETLHESRANKAREDAKRSKIAREKEEIELAALRGGMVRVADVTSEAVAAYLIVRTKLLAIPTKIAGRVALMKDPHAIRAMLEDTIKESLDEISDTLADGKSTDTASASHKRGIKARAKIERKRVGRPKRSPLA